MGIATRAVRNISRRKVRASLVIVALGFSMAIMISIPAGVSANQASTLSLTENLGNTITQTQATINKTRNQIDLSLIPSFEGFGFRPSDMGNFTPGQPPGGQFNGGGNFTPGQFGGGIDIPGMFGGGAFGGGGTTAMNESLYYDIGTIKNVAAIVPILQVTEGTNRTIEMFDRTFTRLIEDYVIVGIPLTSSIDSYPVLPTNITSGRNLQIGESGVVLLSENNTAFFGAEVGDTIKILEETFEVVGVHGSTGTEDRVTLYMNLSDAQSLTNNTGYITSLKVFATSSDYVTQVADDISALHPELSVVTGEQRLEQLEATQTVYENALNNAETTLAQSQTVAFQEVVVAVAATSLIVLILMLYTVRERTKEIGTLKAIGFSNSNVMGQFMLEGIFLSLIAGIVAIAISSLAAPTLSGLLLPAASQMGGGAFVRGTPTANLNVAATSVTLTPELVLIALGASALLGALGSLYPAWRAARTRPAEAMRYE